MAVEPSSADPYEAVIADLTAKRDQLDALITNLSAFRAAGGLIPMNGVAPSGPKDAASETLGDDINSGAFLGMSIVDATKKLLSVRKRAMANADILSELKRGGLHLNSADPLNTVGSVLTRRFNQIGDVVRVSRGTWGLKEWYPGRNFKPVMKTVQGDPVEPGRAMTADEKAMMDANIAVLDAQKAGAERPTTPPSNNPFESLDDEL